MERELKHEFARARALPKRDEHFRKHGQDFVDLGITTPTQLDLLFVHHIQRADLRYFTYISTQATQYRQWVLASMDNGVMVIYNESTMQHWSIFRPESPAAYVLRQTGWWIEVSNDNGAPRLRRI